MTDKLRLDIPLLLPDVPDARDACVTRLVETLSEHDGVEEVHVVDPTEDEKAKLCIHYDPDVLSLGRIRRQAIRSGAHLTGRFGHAVLRVSGIGHARRARTVTERLRRTPGVIEAEATAAGLVRVEFERDVTGSAALRKVLRTMGVRVLDEKAPPEKEAEKGEEEEAEPHEHEGAGLFGERSELIFSVISGVFVATGFGLSFVAALPDWIPRSLYIGAYVFGGFYTLREALDAMRVGRFEIDFLMIVAAAGAAALGRWLEGAFLLFLFSLGHALEHYAMGKAKKAIEGLADLSPDTAVVRRGDEEEEVTVEELEVGDVVIVRPDERVPADGFVVEGTSSVDQASVTGESVPVEKEPVGDREEAMERWEKLEPQHRVFAGTINGSGILEVVVAKRAGESTLARVVDMVAEAETQQSPTQRFTDRFERIFVPVVLGFTVLLLFAWLVVDEPFSASFYRSMAVLVAASPCALAIATPSAVLSAVARAGRGGVLVKGGGPLENLGALGAIAFDKTGTITAGRPHVTDVVPAEGVSEDRLMQVAVAVEQFSDHPLAAAVVRHGEEMLDGRADEEAQNLESITGRGVKAVLNDEPVYIGKDDLFGDVDGPSLPDAVREVVDRLEGDGRTTMIVRLGERYLGVIGVMDTPRSAAAAVVEKLRTIGIRRMVMISGDNQRVAEAVAREVGLDEAYGDLMPDEKVDTVKELSRSEKVAMVGDGVNDAPAMAHATVGIAMGAAGSDVAMETADVALMADDLNHLPFAVDLSRRTGRIIKQNLWLSLGMVAVLIPATVLGLHIGPAVVLHEGSTLAVVANALRLLAYDPSA